MIFREKSCLLAASLAFALLPGYAQAETLPEVVERVLLQQPSVHAAQALLQAAESQVSQARSEFFPTAGLSYRNAKLQDETLGQPTDRKLQRSDASVRWNLFRGASDIHRLKASRHTRDAADADLDEALEAIAAEITENYTDIVRLQATQDCLAAAIEQQERLRALIEKRIEAGRIAPSELDLIRTRLIQNQNLLGQFRAQLGSAEFRYRILTGSPPLDLKFPSLRPEASNLVFEEITARIASLNPRLRASWQRVAARDAEINVARGGHLPAIDLEFSKRLANRTEPVLTSDNDTSTQIRVNLEVPLGGRNFSRQSEAVALHLAAKAEAEKLAQDIGRDVSNLTLQLAEARLIAPSLAERVLAAQRVVFAYEQQFNAGRRSIMDLSNALDELFEAQRNLVDNHAQQTTLLARLLSLEGGLRRALTTQYASAPISPSLLSPLPPKNTIGIGSASPEPTAVTSAKSQSAALESQLLKRIELWRSRWIAGDYSGYRQLYSRDFRPADGQSTETWEKVRQARLSRARSPMIAIESLNVREISGDQAITDFIQTYVSRGFRDRVSKRLSWVRSDGDWVIAAEELVTGPSK